MEIKTTKKEEITLSLLRCPSCGNPVNYHEGDKEVMCMACGNVSILTKNEITEQKIEGNVQNVSSINTSSSALAYIDQFLDNHDWEDFAFTPSFNIDRLEKVVEKLKVTSADDYHTWIAAYLILVTPFNKKVEYQESIYHYIINEYKNDNTDAYTLYDSFKENIHMIIAHYPSVNEKAKKILEYAKKYGISKEELNNLEKQFPYIDEKKLSSFASYDSFDDIPEIKEYNENKNQNIALELSKEGINAEEEYQKGLELLNKRQFSNALFVLLKLKNYKDAQKIRQNLKPFYLVDDDVLIKDDLIYLYQKQQGEKYQLREHVLSSEKEEEVFDDASNIVLAVYNDYFIYFNDKNNLKVFDLKEDKEVYVSEKMFDKKHFMVDYRLGSIYLYGDKAIYCFDLKKLEIKEIKQEVKEILAMKSHTIIYNKADKNSTVIMDTKSDKQFTVASGKKINIVDYIDQTLIFTTYHPHSENQNLYAYNFDKEEIIQLEQNIAGNVKIINDRIFYLVKDNRNIEFLITIDLDGNNRKEIINYAREALFIKGEWLYFIRGYLYNTALAKINLVTKQIIPLAAQISRLIKMELGYIYFVDTDDCLHQIRMDGSEDTVLCKYISDVVKVTPNYVIYIAKDGDTKSLYSYSLSERGHEKAAYSVSKAICYYDSIYYVHTETRETVDSSGMKSYVIDRHLGIYNLETHKEKVLFKIGTAKKKSGCYVATCVYNSYDCPEVWRLRRYRDNYLDNHWWGRLFIKLYYKVSPTLVRWFGNKNWFRKPIKSILDRKINKLKKKGYDDTPYIDKY